MDTNFFHAQDPIELEAKEELAQKEEKNQEFREAHV